MGFSWSLFFAQSRKPSTTESRRPSLRHFGEMTDRGPPLVLSNRGQNAQTGHYWYVDNIGIVSAQFSQVHVTLDERKQDFEKDRLMLHVIFVRSDSGRAIGFELHVEQLQTLPVVERCGRIRKGLRCFSGWELECLMGHVTFLGLLRRETMSLFHSVCRFARNFYHQREPLCISARAELEVFAGIMILIEAGFLASDATLSDHGVAQNFWNYSHVAAVGRVPEVRRWTCGTVLARRHAFESADFPVDSCSGKVLRDCFGRPISLDPEMAEIIASERWETDSSFPEVPSRLLSSHSWKKGMADKWFFDDDILRFEAWALVEAAERAAHTPASTRLQDQSSNCALFHPWTIPRRQPPHPDHTFCIGTSGEQHHDQHQMDIERTQQQ